MTLQPRSALIKGFELFHGKKSSQGHDHVLPEGGMPFGKNKPVPLGPSRFFRPDIHDAKVERDQHVHRRERPTHVSGAASRHGADGQPASSLSQLFQFVIVYLVTHSSSWVNNSALSPLTVSVSGFRRRCIKG